MGENYKAFEYLGNSLTHDPKNAKTILAAGSIIQVCALLRIAWAPIASRLVLWLSHGREDTGKVFASSTCSYLLLLRLSLLLLLLLRYAHPRTTLIWTWPSSSTASPPSRRQTAVSCGITLAVRRRPPPPSSARPLACDLHRPISPAAVCFFGKQKYVAAVACLKRALFLDPFEWIIAYNLGLVHLSTGQHASAFHYFSARLGRGGDTRQSACDTLSAIDSSAVASARVRACAPVTSCSLCAPPPPLASINLKPDFASSYMYLGITLARLEDVDNACSAYDKVCSSSRCRHRRRCPAFFQVPPSRAGAVPRKGPALPPQLRRDAPWRWPSGASAGAVRRV